MAKNVSLLGANYPDVPAVDLPQTGGGTARFIDISDTTATDADVKSGKQYYKANGVKSTGAMIGTSVNVTPYLTQQIIQPPSGYSFISQVNVQAITITETDNVAGGKTATIGVVNPNAT